MICVLEYVDILAASTPAVVLEDVVGVGVVGGGVVVVGAGGL